MSPREGHLEAALRVLAYLKQCPQGRILIDTSIPSSKLTTEEVNWRKQYPDGEEELPPNMPQPWGWPVRITAYVAADHAHDLVTRRSVGGVVIFLNNTPVRWLCKSQPTVKTSTYVSEMVVARVATEMVMELQYQLRTLGVALDGPTHLYGDNKSVVLNFLTPSSILKKPFH